jgi:hypothetical protein
MEDQDIRVLLSRLARPHASGGQAIERAALLAEGAEFPAIMAWITAHAGQPESAVVKTSAGGLHSARMNDTSSADRRAPQRYVLPAATLS